MTKEKAIRMALSLVLDRAFEASENYGMQTAAKGFEREFAEAMACADILKTMMGSPQTLAVEGEEEEQRIIRELSEKESDKERSLRRRAARGFEREFAEAMACADILKTMMGSPQTLAFEGEEEEQRKTESFPRRKAVYKGACDDVAAEA